MKHWIEDKCVAEYLLKILMVFLHLNVVSDLTIAELQFFNYIMGLLQLFLKLYQTDQPMLSLLFDGLKVRENSSNKYYQSKCT